MNLETRTSTKVAYALAGGALLLVVAQAIGHFEIAGKAWPPLTDVVAYASSTSGASLVWRNLLVTLGAGAQGFVLGTVVALIGATLALVVPILQPGLDRFAAILNAVPTIALAPLLITTAGREGTPAIIAALSVGFVMFVSMTSGFAHSSPVHQDLLTVFGSNRMRRLALLDLPRAVPAFLDGLTLAAPAAVLGATIGEWFGAPRGIGLLLVSAMQNYQMPLLWSAALAATALSLVAYLVLVQVQRLAVRRFS